MKKKLNIHTQEDFQLNMKALMSQTPHPPTCFVCRCWEGRRSFIRDQERYWNRADGRARYRKPNLHHQCLVKNPPHTHTHTVTGGESAADSPLRADPAGPGSIPGLVGSRPLTLCTRKRDQQPPTASYSHELAPGGAGTEVEVGGPAVIRTEVKGGGAAVKQSH